MTSSPVSNLSSELSKELKNPFSEAKIYLHGPPKVGKTTLASTFPNPFFIGTEPGHKFLRRGKVISLRYGKEGWEKFKKILAAADKIRSFDTIVIDTIDGLYQTCFDFVCDDKGIDHPGDEGYGKGWDAIRLEFVRRMESLMNICELKTVFFISHTKEAEIKTAFKDYTKMMSTLKGQARGIVLPIPDYIWFLTYNAPEGTTLKHYSTERALFCRGSESIEAGDREGMLPAKIEKLRINAFKHICEVYSERSAEKTRSTQR